MIFVHTFDNNETFDKISDEVSDYLKCGAEVTVRSRRVNGSGNPVAIRIEIEVDNPHEFLQCAARYVDEHTLSSWERQAEEADEDADFSGPHSREGFKATGGPQTIGAERAKQIMQDTLDKLNGELTGGDLRMWDMLTFVDFIESTRFIVAAVKYAKDEIG